MKKSTQKRKVFIFLQKRSGSSCAKYVKKSLVRLIVLLSHEIMGKKASFTALPAVKPLKAETASIEKADFRIVKAVWILQIPKH